MTAMKELHDVAVSYDQAFADFEAKIEEGRRAWSAQLLRNYPFKSELEQVAEALRKDLQTAGIEVNSISTDVQTTIAQAPPKVERAEVPVRDSLCVLTVGANEPTQVSDIQHDKFTSHHAAKILGLASWASVPIQVNGVPAGTVCALESRNARIWTDREQGILEQTAIKIGELVTDWAEHTSVLDLG